MKKITVSFFIFLFFSCSSLNYYENTFGGNSISMINVFFAEKDKNMSYSVNASYNAISKNYKLTVFYYSLKEKLDLSSLKINNNDLKYFYRMNFEYVPILKNFYYKHYVYFVLEEKSPLFQEIIEKSSVNLYFTIENRKYKFSIESKMLDALKKRALEKLKIDYSLKLVDY